MKGYITTRSANEVQHENARVFTERLRAVFAECHRVLRSDGILIFTYHHSRIEGWTAVLEAVRQGRTVGLVADRDILGSGVEVEFFGETTTLPAGPAVLALRTGVPLLPCAIYFDGPDGHRVVIRPPLAVAREGGFREDVQRVTQVLAHELEELIRAAPEQWHLMQPNWPSDPGWPHQRTAER